LCLRKFGTGNDTFSLCLAPGRLDHRNVLLCNTCVKNERYKYFLYKLLHKFAIFAVNATNMVAKGLSHRYIYTVEFMHRFEGGHFGKINSMR